MHIESTTSPRFRAIQWHVLNKEQSWLTEAVRAKYSGSYMIERPFQQALGGMKMVAGTAYMIRSDEVEPKRYDVGSNGDLRLLHLGPTAAHQDCDVPWCSVPAGPNGSGSARR